MIKTPDNKDRYSFLQGENMNFGSIDEILDFAIDREKEAVAFYTDLSKKQKVADLQQTFFELAQEEGKHVKLITGLKQNKVAIDSYEIKEVTNLKISDYVADIKYEEGMAMADILVLAMKREAKALKLYQDLVDLAENDEARKLFELLAQEESQHKLRFETMYDDYLQDQGN